MLIEITEEQLAEILKYQEQEGLDTVQDAIEKAIRTCLDD